MIDRLCLSGIFFLAHITQTCRYDTGGLVAGKNGGVLVNHLSLLRMAFHTTESISADTHFLPLKDYLQG